MNVYIGGPTSQQVTNYVPQMTANTQDGYTATSSTQLSDVQPWMAFYVSTQGGSPTYGFHSNAIGSGNRGWSQIQLPKGIIVNKIEIGARRNESSSNLWPIGAFSLKGSNDGSTWTEIKAVSGLGSSWSIGSVQSWNITGQTTAYTYLKLEVQAYSSYVAFDYWNIDGTVVEVPALKNAYIGEYKGYEYSYDFRNKTLQNMTDDGWTFSPSGSSSVYFDSNGMYCTTSSWRPIQHDIDLSNANKVTIESNCTLVSSRNYFLGIGTAYTEGNPNGTYMYFALNTTSIGILNTTVHTDYTKPTGGFTARIEIDFTNKTIASYIGDSQYYTQSLTDARVTTMKSYNKLQLGTAVSQNYAVDISITIRN